MHACPIWNSCLIRIAFKMTGRLCCLDRNGPQWLSRSSVCSGEYCHGFICCYRSLAIGVRDSRLVFIWSCLRHGFPPIDSHDLCCMIKSLLKWQRRRLSISGARIYACLMAPDTSRSSHSRGHIYRMKNGWIFGTLEAIMQICQPFYRACRHKSF